MRSRKHNETEKRELNVAREVMGRRSQALEALAQVDLAEQIMNEDRKIRRGLAKK